MGSRVCLGSKDLTCHGDVHSRGNRVMDIDISAIVMTRNEAKNIAKCLNSLRGIDQIFVVDSESTDGTQDIAGNLGATVVDFCWDGNYPKKKQWCLDNLPFAHDWVFYVDADEEATPELIAEIAQELASPSPATGYFVGYDYVFLGKTLKHGQRVFKLVMFDRHHGHFDPVDDLQAENMWEVEGHYQPRIDGRTARIYSPMLHNDHDSLYHYFDRHNRYSDWEAVVRSGSSLTGVHESQVGKRTLLKRVFDPLPLKAPAAFFYTYVIRGGFRDGRAGFQYAVAKAFYYWQIELKISELKIRDGSADD